MTPSKARFSALILSSTIRQSHPSATMIFSLMSSSQSIIGWLVRMIKLQSGTRCLSASLLPYKTVSLPYSTWLWVSSTLRIPTPTHHRTPRMTGCLSPCSASFLVPSLPLSPCQWAPIKLRLSRLPKGSSWSCADPQGLTLSPMRPKRPPPFRLRASAERSSLKTSGSATQPASSSGSSRV